jgi:hypothetical protein
MDFHPSKLEGWKLVAADDRRDFSSMVCVADYLNIFQITQNRWTALALK